MAVKISKYRVKLEGVLLQTGQSASIASASSIDLLLASGNEVHITGSSAITSFGVVPAGTSLTLIFDGTPTLVYNATSMVLNTGGVDFTATSGDRAFVISEGDGNWLVNIVKKDGTALAASMGAPSSNSIHKAQLAMLKLRDIPDTYTPKPVLSFSQSEAMTGAGFKRISKDDASLYYGHTQKAAWSLVTYPYYLYNVGRSVNYGTSIGSDVSTNNMSVCFQTNAPKFELYIGGYSANVNIIVDGKYLNAEAADIAIPNDGAFDFITVDFGSNTQGNVAYPTLASGGSGYVVGEVLSLVGGSGSPMTVTVQSETAGVITKVGINSFGNYTTLPTGTIATTTAGSGSGATFNLGSVTAQNHTTRKMRRIEVIGTSGFAFGGLNVRSADVVQSYSLEGVRLMVIGDSFAEQSQAEYAGGTYPFRIGRRLGIDDVWTSGVGGAGYLATLNGTRMKYRDRFSDVISNTTDSPYVVLIQGSVNDSTFTSGDIQTEVTALWNYAFTQLPNAYFIGTTGFTVPGAGLSSPQALAISSGIQASQAIHDPTGKRSGIIDTWAASLFSGSGYAGATNGTGGSDFYIASDSIHPTQVGHDYLGDFIAAELARIFTGFSQKL